MKHEFTNFLFTIHDLKVLCDPRMTNYKPILVILLLSTLLLLEYSDLCILFEIRSLDLAFQVLLSLSTLSSVRTDH